MAGELRWILLAIGLALIGGLWWWERRRALAPPEEAAARAADRFEPRLDGDSAPGAAAHATPPDEDDERLVPEPEPVEPPMRARADERPVPRGDPPVVTLHDLPEDTEDVVLAREPAPVDRHAAAATTALERRRPRLEPEPAAEPPVEDGVAVASEPPHIDTIVDPPSPPAPEPPPRHQRIVAIRLVVPPDRRIDGGPLKKALAAEGLEFGRYSIFHRIIDGGRPLYSVASLVEPGSFDPDLMGSLRFPGISLFAVFPGPLPAPQTFDDLLATARRLADRLGAALQDDTGSSLTGQRVLSIREDLVHFEHLVGLSRTRPTG